MFFNDYGKTEWMMSLRACLRSPILTFIWSLANLLKNHETMRGDHCVYLTVIDGHNRSPIAHVRTSIGHSITVEDLSPASRR
jgi:hypothetical protein